MYLKRNMVRQMLPVSPIVMYRVAWGIWGMYGCETTIDTRQQPNQRAAALINEATLAASPRVQLVSLDTIL